tara:strand:+ start:423 stop:1556 length:1134 start_codon:yes stop_codon:yes gene_type:complete
MNCIQYSHEIAPRKVYRGSKTWENNKHEIPITSKRPLLIGRSGRTLDIRKKIHRDCINLGINPCWQELKYGCCEYDIQETLITASTNKVDAVIAIGGGKVLDAGKLIADRISIPCITIPTSAATCAGWTSLSNIYTQDGAFIRDIKINNCPDLLIFDHDFVKSAPRRTLASGIADALAKWYEASLTSSKSFDGLTLQAVQMARVLRDQLFIDSVDAFNNIDSLSWTNVSEACALTAGLIGGIGGAKCRTAAAHALHNGLTQLKTTKNNLHGEIVGYGILIQMKLEENITNNQLTKQSRKQLIPLFNQLKLPTTLHQLGLSQITDNELEEVCKFSCNRNSDIHRLPFEVNYKELQEAILISEKEIIKSLKTNHYKHTL